MRRTASCSPCETRAEAISMRLTRSSSSSSRAMESFFAGVERNARRLLAVAQRGIHYFDRGSIVAGYFRASSNRRIWSGDAAQVIHVVVAVLQAAFLVGVDLEPLAAARGFGGQRLPVQIDRETGRGIVVYGGEDRREELVAYRDRQQTVVEGVVAEDVGEETRHHDAEAVVGDGPCGVFARTAAPGSCGLRPVCGPRSGCR